MHKMNCPSFAPSGENRQERGQGTPAHRNPGVMSNISRNGQVILKKARDGQQGGWTF